MVIDCIEDDFDTFLDRRYFRSVEGKRRCDHIAYRDKFGLESIINHRDPTKPADYAYYVRCVERFRHLRRTPTRYACFSRSGEGFGRLLDAVASVSGMLTFVQIKDATGEPPVAELLEAWGAHRMLALSPMSARSTVGFQNFADDLALHSILNQVVRDKFAGAGPTISQESS